MNPVPSSLGQPLQNAGNTIRQGVIVIRRIHRAAQDGQRGQDQKRAWERTPEAAELFFPRAPRTAPLKKPASQRNNYGGGQQKCYRITWRIELVKRGQDPTGATAKSAK